MESFYIISQIFIEVSGVDVDSRVGLCDGFQDGGVGVSDVADVVIQIEEGVGVVGGVVVTHGGLFHLEWLLEGVV